MAIGFIMAATAGSRWNRPMYAAFVF